MGVSTDGILAYGYDLGALEDFQVKEVDEYGGLVGADWYDEDDDDFVTQVEKHLMTTVAGFTETDWRAPGFYDREREAKARLGVEVQTHCSDEYPMYLLAAKVITASRGNPQVLDGVDLAKDPVTNRWDDKLSAALKALGLTPVQEKPVWLLCSDWG